MYSVLIVDDESATRAKLSRLVDWDSLGFSTVVTASSGRRAQELCPHLQPDLAIIDVRMPQMDGIEFCRWFLTGDTPREAIFLSGYDEKSYLKAAIRLGAGEYLEKPISAEGLSRAVLRAAAKLDRARAIEPPAVVNQHAPRPSLSPTALLDLLGNATLTAEEARILIGECPVLSDCLSYNTLVTQHRNECLQTKQGGRTTEVLSAKLAEQARSRQAPVLTAATEDRVVVVAGFGARRSLSVGELQELIFSVAEGACGSRDSVAVGVGSRVDDLESIPVSYKTAQRALEQTFRDGFGRTYRRGERHGGRIDSAQIEAVQQTLSQAARSLSEGRFRASIERARNLILDVEGLSREEMLRALISCCEEAYHYLRDLSWADDTAPQYQLHVWSVLTESQTFDEAVERLSGWYLHAMGEISRQGDFSRPVFEAARYIESHFALDVSLSGLAERVGLSPSHLSRTFHAQVGKTISEFLTERRIEEAKRLLLHDDDRIYRIADRVGYRDYRNFERQFRRRVGMSPSTFVRQRLGRAEEGPA